MEIDYMLRVGCAKARSLYSRLFAGLEALRFHTGGSPSTGPGGAHAWLRRGAASSAPTGDFLVAESDAGMAGEGAGGTARVATHRF
jgi:hypothetical protein